MLSWSNDSPSAASRAGLLTLIALTVCSCGGLAEPEVREPAAEATASDPTALDLAERPATEGPAAVAVTPADLTSLEINYLDGRATLTDGKFELFAGGASPVVSLALDQERAFGDLTGDGVDDAAAVLVNSPGGSGTFRILLAVTGRSGRVENVASLNLGDRLRVSDLAIESGMVTAKVLSHRDTDPLCCPSLEEARRWALQGSALVPVEDS